MNEAIVIVDNHEESLGKEASLVEQQAQSIVITNDAEYAAAGSLLRQIKSVQKQVKEYWEPLRVDAKRTYDNILSRKKAMLDPLTSAEATLKQKVKSYTDELERIRRQREEELRLQAQAELERKLAEAARLSESGDEDAAEYAMAEAEVMEITANTAVIPKQKPKVVGVYTSKTWEITGINDAAVPVEFNGSVIRPVDTAAIMRLIKDSKGTIKIPGVTYKETVSVRARA